MPPTQDEARRALRELIEKYNELSDTNRQLMSEVDVVNQFIAPFLRDVLGWPTDSPTQFKYELYTEVGRPDMTLLTEGGKPIFVEAKRLGVIKEHEIARRDPQMRGVVRPKDIPLTGIVTDRPEEDQQAINYAFRSQGEWAILTNFERLRLYNARRDWLVLAFDTPRAYEEYFNDLWQLAYPNILNGSLDALSNQRLTEEVDTKYLQFINKQRLALAQDILSRRDKNTWAFHADGTLNLPLLRSVVQRYLDRLVVVRFAEDQYVIPAGMLLELSHIATTNRYSFPLDRHLDQFFTRFDEEHNSALFSRGTVDEASFSNEALKSLIAELYQARYRSMPADIMGNTYEQYLGKTLALDNDGVTTRDNLETRKKQGSYYTPQVIVRYIVDHSLGRYLYGTANGQPDGEPVEGETRQTSASIRDLRVLDSACGSGSFLIYAYEVLAKFYQSEIERLRAESDRLVQEMAARFTEITLDDRVASQRVENELIRIQHYPRLILEGHLYGVDLDPQAAEIAVVNLMMRAMERRATQEDKRLPLILNQNIKVGNSLIGLRPDDERLNAHREQLAALRRLRSELVGTSHTDPAHARILDDIDTATHALYTALEPDFAAHFSDVERARPFHWGIEFPEAFYDAQGQPLPNPGFTVIFGNPPWEIVKPDLREFYAQFDARIESQLNRQQVEKRIEELKAEDPRRERDFEAQVKLIGESANYYRASSDYTRQGRGDTATHKLFTERAWMLLNNGGRLGYVVPSGIYTDLGTKALREMLLNEGHIQYVYSFSNERYFFPGVDHRFKFALLGAHKGVSSDGFWAAFRFNPRVAVAPDDLPIFLANRNNLVFMKRESLEKFSPDSLSLMEFQTQLDYETTQHIYGEWPIIGKSAGAWQIKLQRELDVTLDRQLFNTKNLGLPLYEGKMIHQYDAFFAEPSYWVAEEPAKEKLSNRTGNDYQNYRLAFRDIARTTDARTLISAVLPKNAFCNNKTPLIKPIDTLNYEATLLYLCALLNSLVLDFVIRQKVSTTLNFFYMETLPVPRLTAGHPAFDALVERAARLVCTRAEFAGLWREVTGGEWVNPHPNPPPNSGEGVQPAVEAGERQRLRDEIDALVAHLYGLSRAEFEHILRTFPLVFPNTPEGEAKLSALLAVYDAAGQ